MRGSQWVLSGVVLLAAVVVNQSAVHWRSNIADDHLFAYFGWCVSQGAVPYLDIWDNKPPGIWWLSALGTLVFGPGVVASIATAGGALLVAMAALVAAAVRAFGPGARWPATLAAAALLSDQRFECGGNRTETYVIACETLAVACYLAWLDRRRTWLLICGGLLAGAAPLFKQSGLAAGVAIAGHMAWTLLRRSATESGSSSFPRWRDALVLAAAGSTPITIAAVVLAAQGALSEAAFAVGTFNRAYFAIDDATWIHLGRAWTAFAPARRLLAPVFAMALVGLGLGLWRGRVTRVRGESAVIETSRLALVLAWGLLATYLACVGPGRREHHLMPALPALALVLAYPLAALAARGRLSAGLVRSPSSAVYLAVWATTLLVLAAGSLGDAQRCWARKPAWYALQRSTPAPFEAQAAEIARLTHPADRIYVWGWSPGTYRYALRLPASRFATLEKAGQVGPHARFIVEAATADVRRVVPAAMAISDRDLENLRRDSGSELAAWVDAHYDDRGSVQGMHILLRRLDIPAGSR